MTPIHGTCDCRTRMKYHTEKKTQLASNEKKISADKINIGGQRSIVINIGKQIEKMEIHTATMKESVEELEQMISEVMRRVYYSFNQTVS